MKILTWLGLAIVGLFGTAQACELDRNVRLAGMSWMSNLMMVEIEKAILEDGYGCDVVIEAGDTVPMLAAVVRGDVDLYNELWIDSAPENWLSAEARGEVTSLGDTYSGGEEGWWIPRYVAEENPGLISVYDLPDYKDLFEDREDPGMGRIYNCPEGWVCGAVNNNLLKAFELEDDYVMFSPGSGAALDAAISSSYARQRPFVTYYWTPTAILGKFDMVKLEMPEYTEDGHRCNMNPECASPVPGAYPAASIQKTIPTSLQANAPEMATFFSRINIPTSDVSVLLAWADEEGAEPEQVADYFLANYESLWTEWVPADVAEKVKAAL
jgi:glycine betaine/proline transport system substrate-binding protein